MKRAKSKKCLFPAKKRKEMVVSVVRDEHGGIVDKAIEKLLVHVQFKYFPERLKFLQVLDQQLLLQCARNMVNVYLDLLKHYCKGKRYLQLQNSWFFHINLYFDGNTSQCSFYTLNNYRCLCK